MGSWINAGVCELRWKPNLLQILGGSLELQITRFRLAVVEVVYDSLQSLSVTPPIACQNSMVMELPNAVPSKATQGSTTTFGLSTY